MTWPEASLLAFLLLVGVLAIIELHQTRKEQKRWRAFDEAVAREFDRADELKRAREAGGL